uniref:Serine-threonine/tyrosine-protein kinase catalytic domain-containing protein n=1 Tax=Triticum urartu TaxID=4572 RepID=A0A8R7P9M1_TRIUA
MNVVIKEPEGILMEYASKGLFSTNSVIYSFGVLLLEILSRKRNASFLNLIGHVYKLWQEENGHELVDMVLELDCLVSKVMK